MTKLPLIALIPFLYWANWALTYENYPPKKRGVLTPMMAQDREKLLGINQNR